MDILLVKESYLIGAINDSTSLCIYVLNLNETSS